MYILERVLLALIDNGNLNRTALASKTRLNYSACVRYIKFLELLRWAELRPEDNTISLTSDGLHSGRTFIESLRARNAKIPDISAEDSDCSHSIFYTRRTSPFTPDSLLAEEKSLEPRQSVLLIDYELERLNYFKSILEPAGFQVETFQSSADALRHCVDLKHFTYGVVIINMRMPIISGLSFYKALRAIIPSAQIMFISPMDGAVEITSALLGITSDLVISKPLSGDEILRKVGNVLRHGYAKSQGLLS